MNSETNAPAATDRMASLADLTRRYAAWTHDEGGLPLVWGGLTLALLVGHRVALGALASYLDHSHPIPAAQLRAWSSWGAFLDHIRPILLGALPVAWVLGKDPLRRRLYQDFGRVEPAPLQAAAWVRRSAMALLFFAGFGIPILASWLSGPDLASPTSPFERALGLTACWALPALGWSRVRGWQENLVWAPMALMTLASLWSPVLWAGYLGWVLSPLLLAMIPVAIGTGMAQHLRYLGLRRELRALEAP